MEQFRDSYLGLSDFIFTRGSIAAQWQILLTEDSEVTNDELNEALATAVEEAEGELIEGLPVKPDTIAAAGIDCVLVHGKLIDHHSLQLLFVTKIIISYFNFHMCIRSM